MQWIDIIINAVIAALAVLALVFIIRRRRKGKGCCCGDCSRCGMNCKK